MRTIHRVVTIMVIGILSTSLLAADRSGFFTEIGIGAAMEPYTSTRPIYGFSANDAVTLPVEPETFSSATSNMGDTYLYVGYIGSLFSKTSVVSNAPFLSDMGLEIGVRAHKRKGVTYEVDFVGRFRLQITRDWDWYFGGSFGEGKGRLNFDALTIRTNTGITRIVFPEKMIYSTGSGHVGTSYWVTDRMNIGLTYEIKENIFDTEEMQEQVKFNVPGNPLSSLTLMQMLTSYRTTTHTAYLSLRYDF